MSAMISIDFGNSYTKVAVRLDTDRQSELLADASLSLDELNICIPTLAARLRKNGRESWYFGNDVMQHRVGTPGLTIFRNWKPLFFKGVETHSERRRPAPVVAATSKLLAGNATAGLTDEKWHKLQAELGLPESARAAIEAAMRASATTADENADKRKEETDIDIKQVGLGFFRWLKGFVQPICQKKGLATIDQIPVRISLPSFGAATKAEMLLREMLEEAGWTPDDRAPALAEPLSNSIGTFTEGRNAVHTPKRSGTMPHYGMMFADTGLLKAMREAILHDGPKVAWAVIADLGGYTADFAMVCLNLEDIDARIEGTIDGKPRAAQYSEPLGVSTLDQRVRDGLSDTKRVAFDQMEKDPDQRRLETFHRSVYGKMRPYVLRNATIGEGNELEQIRECVEEFAEEVADCAEKFMETHQYDKIDDLILTGGGSMIPAVRSALRNRLERFGVRKTHMYFEPSEKLSPKYHRLQQSLVRGATALGGASVYFDFAE
jgi:hypothetical protein